MAMVRAIVPVTVLVNVTAEQADLLLARVVAEKRKAVVPKVKDKVAQALLVVEAPAEPVAPDAVKAVREADRRQ